MKIVNALRRLRRSLTPPGSRALLDSSYKQPNLDPTHVSPASSAHQQQQAPSG